MHRKLIIGAAVAAASLGVAAPAMAQTPVNLTFNNFVLNTPATPDAALVSPSTKPVTITADVDTTTGAFTIQPSDFSMPSYSFTSPVPGSVQITLKAPASGTFNATTGAVTINADFLADITLTGSGSCTKDTGALTLTTAAKSPLPGTAFPAGDTGLLTGNGALGASWSTLAPGTGPACTLVDGATNGVGGIWISRGISPKTAAAGTAPKLALVATSVKPVKTGKTVTVDATLANTGAADTKSVKVCLAAKKPLSPAKSCTTVKAPGAASKTKLSFKVKTKGAKAGKYKLALSAAGATTKSVTLTVTK